MGETLSGWRRFLLEWSDVPLRAALAATFIVHGYDKVFVKAPADMTPFLETLGVPAPAIMAWVVALTELVGGAAIAVGLLTRLAALGIASIMLVAIFGVHFKEGFAHTPKTGGWEWQFALLCIALCLIIRGAGPLSLDRVVAWYRRRGPAAPGHATSE